MRQDPYGRKRNVNKLNLFKTDVIFAKPINMKHTLIELLHDVCDV